MTAPPITELDRAYVAGVLDALGRVRVRELPTGTELAQVSISSPKLELLERVAELTGVKVVPVRRDYRRLGCAAHCQEPHHHVHSYTGRWEVVGARAVLLLRAIEPHLGALQAEAREVLTRCADAPHKPATVRKMVALGWAS